MSGATVSGLTGLTILSTNHGIEQSRYPLKIVALWSPKEKRIISLTESKDHRWTSTHQRMAIHLMNRSSQSESGRLTRTLRQLVLIASVIVITLAVNHMVVGMSPGLFGGGGYGGQESSVLAMTPWVSQDMSSSPSSSSSSSPQSSFSLAYNQSFGFFDDVTDRQWKLSQVLHAKTFPNHFSTDLSQYSSTIDDKGNVPKLKKSPFWYAENFQEEFHCAHSQRIPSDSNGDGPKWVCDPHRIAQQKECLVYSVGSNGNTMFEEGIKREIGEHCEIHTFDLVTSNPRNGDFQQKLQRVGATFHPWGLGTSQQATRYATTGTGPPLYTLAQIMDKLNHTHRMVDIFKIDCEWCEWHTYEDWIQVGNLRQVLVETHNAPMPTARDFFYALHDAGYVIFSKEANFQNGGGGVEYAFLKLHTDFFINNTMYSKLLPH